MRIVLTGIGLITIGLLMAGSSFAKIDPEDVENGHVYLFEDDKNLAKDSSKSNLSGNIRGNPKPVKGVKGQALEFNGVDDTIHIPDSKNINVTSGPWSNRTIKAIFNCGDVSKKSKQTVFEEGGRTRGLVIYVFDGELYAGGWNRDATQSDWNGAWISIPIRSDRWYEVALTLRDATAKVENDKFEMWLDGRLIDKEPGGQLYNHGNDNSIGYTKQNNVFHDDDGSGDGWYFEGLVDEVWILNEALSAEELGALLTSVEPAGKLAASWGAIKAQR